MAADLAPWAILSAAFLVLYVYGFGFPTSAILPHVLRVSTIWLLIAGIRLAVLGFPANASLLRAAASLATTVGLAALITFYSAVAIGLSSWRRVINRQLLSTYVSQWRPTLEILDVPIWLPFVSITLGFCTLWLLSHHLWNGRRWLQSVRDTPLLGNGMGLAIAFILISLALVAKFAISQAVHEQEPFSKAFFQSASEDSKLQNHSRIGSEALDVVEQDERRRYQPNEKVRPRNVVLIVADALRADRSPWSGYRRPLMPFVNALTERLPSTHLSNMRSICGESSCGLMGLIASRFIHATPERPFTLHDVLREHGYRTTMILSGDHTNFYGLRGRYGELDDYFDGSMQKDRYVNDDQLVLDHVQDMPDRAKKTPTLLQFHLMSTHGLGKRHPEAERYLPAENYYRSWLRDGRNKAFRKRAINYYDNGVLQFDQTMKQLIEMLSRKGYLDDGLLVITGDHGDQLGEHDTYAHANSTWEPVLQIPLIIIDFGGGLPVLQPRAITSQIDIAPTLLQALDMPIPRTWQGSPLQAGNTPRLVYFQEGFATGLYDTSKQPHIYKYWRDWHAGTEHVYDIVRDPGEEHDLSRHLGTRQLADWRRDVMGNVAASGTETSQRIID